MSARETERVTPGEGLPPALPPPPSELRRLRVVLSAILRWGVLVSSAVTAVGIVVYLVGGRSGYPHGAYPRTLGMEALGLLAFKPYAVMGLGLLLLAVTPIVRVAAELWIFAQARNGWFTAFAAFAFAMLILSFALGRVI